MQDHYHVFISHATEDKKDVANVIAEAINKDHVWLDTLRIKPGEHIEDKVIEGINQSDYFVLILSPNSITRRWVNREYGIFLGIHSERKPSKFPIIIPVLHNVSVEDAKKALDGSQNLYFLSTENGTKIPEVAKAIIEMIRSNMPNIVVGISGASCSGKTWLAERIHARLPDYSCTFGLDGYYRDLSDVNKLEHTHDNPKAIDFHAAYKDIKSIKSGNATPVRTYDYARQCSTGTILVNPAPIIIIEGLFVFQHQKILELCDVKVWVDCNAAVRLTRRITRDTNASAGNESTNITRRKTDRTIEQTLRKFSDHVEPGFAKFVAPLRHCADLHIMNSGPDSKKDHVMVDVLVAYLNSIRRKTT